MTTPMYGITERKKVELDALKAQIQQVKFAVDQYTLIVSTLTTQNGDFTALLASANTSKETALTNKNSVDQLANQADYLCQNMGRALAQTQRANQKIDQLTASLGRILHNLIFAAEVLNKLLDLIQKKKALNALISENLVESVTEGGKTAATAIANILSALKASYASVALSQEALALTHLENTQMERWLALLAEGKTSSTEPSLQELLDQVYEKATGAVQQVLQAKDRSTAQLNQAKGSLDVAQLNLNSLNSGYAAANAATKAS